MNAISQTWAKHQAGVDPILLQFAIDTSSDSLVLVENGLIVFANPAFASLFGFHDRGELNGRALAEMVPGSRACTRHLAGTRTAENTACGYSSCEFKSLHRDGSSLKVQTSCAHFSHAGRSLL